MSPARGRAARLRSFNIFAGHDSGQALIETVLILPVVLTLIFNAINFGYFFVVALNIAASPRSAAHYSILGASTIAGDLKGMPAGIPATVNDSVAALAYEDLHGALAGYATSTVVQVCSKRIGYDPSTQKSSCLKCTSSTNSCTATGDYTPGSDPESSSFVLNRVDVTYNFKTLISGPLFNLAFMPTSLCDTSGNCSFHRQVSMRAMD